MQSLVAWQRAQLVWVLLIATILAPFPVAVMADGFSAPPIPTIDPTARPAVTASPVHQPTQARPKTTLERLPAAVQKSTSVNFQRLPPVTPPVTVSDTNHDSKRLLQTENRQTSQSLSSLSTTAGAPAGARWAELPPPPSALHEPTPVRQGHIGGPRYQRLPTKSEDVAPPAPLDIVDTLPRVSTVAENQVVQRHVEAGFALAHRGAYYSAKREFEQALRVIAESLDAQQIDGQHGVHLTAAFDALVEADEFFVDDPRSGGRVDLRNVAVTHRTPLMREGKLEGLNQLEAMQAYYTYAQERFRAAVGTQPIAAEALYGLGRTYSALAQTDESIGRLQGPKSLLMHQVASQINPNHSLAANELGVLLARFGQLPEAKRALLQPAPDQRLPETWHNLAVIHERLGEQQLAEQARREYASALQKEQAAQQVATIKDGGVEWYDVSAAETMARQEAPAEKTTPRSAARPAPLSRSPWSTPR